METQQKEIHLTGKEGSEFDLDLAVSWTKNYRDKHPGDIVSHFFGKEILQKLLNQEGCQGIRFYHAHSKPLNGWQRSMVGLSNFLTKVVGNIEGEKHLIIIGASSDGTDLIDIEAIDALSGGGSTHVTTHVTIAKKYMLGDQSSPCPGSPGCPQGVLAVGHKAKN